MSSRKGKRKAQQGNRRRQKENTRWKTSAVIGALVVAAFVATAVLLVLQEPNPTPEPASPTVATRVEERPDVSKLIGNWVRTDGGYIVNVSSVEPGGQLEASYYNPRPIHVSRTEASTEGDTISLFIKLEDEGYPGSTYTLRYDHMNDTLAGIYLQAAIQQSFDVVFVRIK